MTLTWPRFHIHRSILSLDLLRSPNYSLSQSQPSWNCHALSPFPPDDLRLASSQVALLLPPTSADPWCQGSPAASILPSGVRVSVNLSFFQFPSRVVHADPFNSLIANLFHGQIPQRRAAGARKEGGARTKCCVGRLVDGQLPRLQRPPPILLLQSSTGGKDDLHNMEGKSLVLQPLFNCQPIKCPSWP